MPFSVPALALLAMAMLLPLLVVMDFIGIGALWRHADRALLRTLAWVLAFACCVALVFAGSLS